MEIDITREFSNNKYKLNQNLERERERIWVNINKWGERIKPPKKKKKNR